MCFGFYLRFINTRIKQISVVVTNGLFYNYILCKSKNYKEFGINVYSHQTKHFPPTAFAINCTFKEFYIVMTQFELVFLKVILLCLYNFSKDKTFALTRKIYKLNYFKLTFQNSNSSQQFEKLFKVFQLQQLSACRL